MNQALLYYSLVLDILCVTYFLTSMTSLTRKLAIRVRYDKIRFLRYVRYASSGSPYQAVNSVSKRSLRWRFM